MRLLIIFCFLAVVACSGAREPQTDRHNNSEPLSDLQTTIQNLPPDEIFVIAHRGDWRNAPENSIQAIVNCIDMGIDMVEIDVQKTKDGQFVLMHDETIDRTTTGKGKVCEWMLDSLKLLYLKDGLGIKTAHKILTLEEALLVAKDKIYLNLDKAYAHFDEIREILVKTETEDQLLLKGWVDPNVTSADSLPYIEGIAFMPIISLKGSNQDRIVDLYESKYNIPAYELIFDKISPVVYHTIDEIAANGSKAWVNSLWPDLNGGYADELAVYSADSIYGWYIDHNINMIQTDRPALLLDYLRAEGKHR